MKLRKIFALLMTLVMMLGMMPTAGAQGNMLPGGEFTVACNHNWSTRWPNGRPSNCTDWKTVEEYCTLCGAVNYTWEECGRCQAGDWQWVNGAPSNCEEVRERVKRCIYCGEELEYDREEGSHNWYTHVHEQATCTEEGWQEIICSVCGSEKGNPERIPPLGHNWSGWSVAEKATCKGAGREVRSCTRCGISESRSLPALGHDWTAWYTENEPTCTERGTTRMDCERCGTYSFNYLEPTGHAFGEWHVTIEPQPGIPGEEQRECSKCGLIETRELAALEGEQDISTPSCTLSLSSTPANGTHFVVGEEVTFTEHWSNTSGQTLYPFYVTIFTCNAPSYGSDIDQMGSWDAEGSGPVAPGASGSHSLTVTVTEADVARGAIYAMAEILSTVQDGPDVPIVSTPYVSAPCGPELERPAVTFNKHILTTPANGEYFVAGEEIEYCLEFDSRSGNHAFNRGGDESDAVYDIGLYDPLHSSSDPIFLDDRSWDISMPFRYTVTEADVERGYVENTAYVTFSYQPGGEQVTLYSNTVIALCGETGLKVTKTVTNAPTRDSGVFEPGDTISYLVTVVNNTGKELTGLNIFDPLKGENENGLIGTFLKLPAGETATASFDYVATMEDAELGKEGVTNTAYATADLPDGTEVTGTSNTVFTDVCNIGVMDFSKAVVNTPANGMYFVPGETIEFAITLVNNSYYPYYLPTVTDPLCEDQHIYDAANDESYLIMAGEGVFYAGSTESVNVTYVVTEEDAAVGFVENVANVWYQAFNGAEYNLSAGAVAPCGPADMAPVGLVKGIRNTPANGEYFVPGEVIEFTIAATNNTPAALTGVTLSDPMVPGWVYEIAEIAAGETVTTTLSYTVTDFDASIGSVSNYASGRATVQDGYRLLTSNVVTAFTGSDAPIGVVTGLDMVKTVESLPLNGSYYTAGETISFRITYTNVGELPLTDVAIYDPLKGLDEVGYAEKLEPGESRYCTVTYTVTETDMERGYVSNVASSQYFVNGFAGSAVSNTVSVDTDGNEEIWYVFTPWFPGEPTDPDSPYDPISGWDTPEDTPDPFGTIDGDALRGGEDYCARTITARDNVSATYETSFCSGHKTIQSSVLTMNQAAVAPEMQMQAAAYAMTLWRTEVENLYQELFEAADSQAKATLMTEYIRFLTDTANYEAMLNVLYPDQPAVVAQKIAAIWEEKVVTLCYEAHASADQRMDSLLNVAAASGAAAEACTCEAVSEEAGKKVSKQSFCAVHSFPYVMIDALLQGEDTAEAWTRVRQIWWVELTNGNNRIASLLGENSVLAAAEYNALTQWMMAREASLIALYPNNPELVAQTMVKLIMERVNELCQIAQ